jgi:hypothetical protein
MGKKIKITETQLKNIVGGLVTEQTAGGQTGGKQNPNVSPLRGKKINLYKVFDPAADADDNFAFQVQIRNVVQDKNGVIKIMVYTNINEPDMYLEHNCGKNGFKLHKSSFFSSSKDLYSIKLQNKIRSLYCQVSDSGKQEVPKDDELDEMLKNPHSLAENTLKDTFKRLIK